MHYLCWSAIVTMLLVIILVLGETTGEQSKINKTESPFILARH